MIIPLAGRGRDGWLLFVKLIDKSLLRVKSNGKDKPRVLMPRKADRVTLLRVKSNSVKGLIAFRQ